MRELSNNIYWLGIFMILSTNVYLLSECLQLSSWISSVIIILLFYSYVYNLLYVWLLQFTLIKISNIVAPKFPNVLIYSLFYILGGLCFALLGEVPFLHNIAITPGFWGRLNGNAKITIILGIIIFSLLGIRQLYIAIKHKNLCKHFCPYLLFLIFYGLTLTMLILSETKNINVHVHHAICASLLSFWFTDWTNSSSMITHAILMGVVVEGIDFYGIGELSLFMLNNSSKITLSLASLIATIIFFSSCIFLVLIKNYLKKYDIIDKKAEKRKDNNILTYNHDNNYNDMEKFNY